MSTLAFPPIDTVMLQNPARTKGDDPARVHDAASQFEALLIGQILRSARSDGTGWLGITEDSSADSAIDYAEQQFAAVMARGGGLGIAATIERGLRQPDVPPALPEPDVDTEGSKSRGPTSVVRR